MSMVCLRTDCIAKLSLFAKMLLLSPSSKFIKKASNMFKLSSQQQPAPAKFIGRGWVLAWGRVSLDDGSDVPKIWRARPISIAPPMAHVCWLIPPFISFMNWDRFFDFDLIKRWEPPIKNYTITRRLRGRDAPLGYHYYYPPPMTQLN